MAATKDLTVFISTRDATCEECNEQLGKNAWITLQEDKGAYCLSCSDMDHLVFLPSGDATLTRRSKKYSTLHAVVLKWSKRRKRYERQGLLVEEEAREQAEQECFDDSEIRALKRERAAEKRAELDQKYVKRYAEEIRKQYPNCPKGIEKIIAEHACMKYSGRVGRSASAKEFSQKTIELAVMAHIRHTKTNYDQLLAGGYQRGLARQKIQDKMLAVLNSWK